MHDPIGGFERIRDLYLTYLETAFRIRDQGVSAERRVLLERPQAIGTKEDTLSTDPLVEPVPRYAPASPGTQGSELKLEDLVEDAHAYRLPGFTRAEREAFVDLALAGLFDASDASDEGASEALGDAPTGRTADFPLYEHQADMLERGVQPGRPGVVTSGTGSGKTEAFLLPVLARIAKEAASWPAPAPGYLTHRWWHGSGKFRPHREGETRPAAVRALVLYPMNALVEDQLTRIRKALDSEEARSVMDDRFDGNRVFFARYTKPSPVTGHLVHPRPGKGEGKRRRRKQDKLAEAMADAEQTQAAARDRDEKASAASARGETDVDPEPTRFLFPSVDGAELLARWDVQRTPPDLLVTNTSMLSAMLVREVDAPVFKTTRDWIESDPNAYFYLVLDELHLQRGSAGTEVAYLLRVLLERLGLTQPKHRHKLRVLASSASLPVEGAAERARSLQYLYDFFGTNGLYVPGGPPPADGPSAWDGAVVSGRTLPPMPHGREGLDEWAFDGLLSAYGGAERTVLDHPSSHEPAWRAAASGLGLPDQSGLQDLAVSVVVEAGARIAAACSTAPGGPTRATPVRTLAARLFGSAGPDDLDPQKTRAVRGLLVARGAGDSLALWWPDAAKAISERTKGVPSFRVHTFFRAIEGLFAAPDEGAAVDPEFRTEGRLLGPLSVERGVRFSPRPDGSRGNRRLELLYCECCGELYYGGRRGGAGEKSGVALAVELLPYEPDVSNLPEAARQRLFEELSFDDYAVFWPSTRPPATAQDGEPTAGQWTPAWLDPATGVVRASLSRERGVAGQLFTRPPGHRDERHGRANAADGTSVPFACPYCGTNYGLRRPTMRLSPLRSFRAGFAKTTQLLVTELFDVLRLASGEAKLISFSDSRQEAARAALDVESGHHGDLRRDLLVAALREAALADAQLDPELTEELIQEALATRNFARAADLEAQVRAAGATAADDAVPLDRVAESTDRKNFLSATGASRVPLRPFLAGFVGLGIHPSDAAGVARVAYDVGGERRTSHWAELFELGPDGQPDWHDDADRAHELDQARVALVSDVQTVLSDALFSRNYFALEETGIGYPCLLGVDAAQRGEADAFLRVFTDAYRLRDDPYGKPGNDQRPDWGVAGDVNPRNRVRRFAEKVAGSKQGADAVLDRVLTRLARGGHAKGFVATAPLGVRLTKPEDPFWRCDHCGRVHLHRGVGVCTRCFQVLPHDPAGRAGDLRDRHYLTKRVEREAPPFRLRCEELTGQTFDPADRQRRFRGVILDAAGSAAPTRAVPLGVNGRLRRAASIVDLLTVTTTMEVGVDVGTLQATVQANMPPQRFNYQQRVGRAGRRRQAFSFVLTVCRNRNHDLHYFRNPEAITGDAPPPPFLSKNLPEPALRFARKAWLWRAFDRVRAECKAQGEPYPGDALRPPDVHGEFVPTREFFENESWQVRLREALVAEVPFKDEIIAVLSESSRLVNLDLSVDGLMADLATVAPTSTTRLEAAAAGLGQTLAEAGLLPMLGMPTRVRNLYYDAEAKGSQFRRRTEWKTIDRDLDVAIYEFAPGSVLVNDKVVLECVGFTGPLPDRSEEDASGRPTFVPLAPALSEAFWLSECERCGGWNRLADEPDPLEPMSCVNCKAPLDPSSAAEHRVPNGFRTDLRPKPFDPDLRSPRRSGFGVVAEATPADFQEGLGNVAWAISGRARTYRVNGRDGDGYRASTVRDWKYGPRRSVITGQVVAGEADDLRERFDLDGPRYDALHLAAPKTTDALYLAPRAVHPHLDLLPRRDGARHTAVRAAALSAAFLLTYRAAQELDIDPDELEVVEPRVIRLHDDGPRVPALQLTDQLVNGAGYCRQLAETDSDGVPLAVRLAQAVVSERHASPLAQLLATGHPRECDQACYRCLQRYGNQSYHGLLDWRLGLAYLQALLDPAYACGLDGFGRDGFGDDPATADWLALAKRYAVDLVGFDGAGEVRTFNGLVGFRVRPGGRWALVVHPLWDVSSDALPSVVDGALTEIETAGEVGTWECVDTFDLARSSLAVRQRLL